MTSDSLPLVLAGPILRLATPERLVFWLATSTAIDARLQLSRPADSSFQLAFSASQLAEATQQLQLAEALYLQMIDLPLLQALPVQQQISYDLQLKPQSAERWQNCNEWASALCYPGQQLPFFRLEPKVRQLLHGSCRKPHFAGPDGLVRADQFLQQCSEHDWPSLLMLSGDQIYADDVATPMLYAIHQLANKLGFANEHLPEADIQNSVELHQQRPYYGQREQLLPDTKAGQQVLQQLFKGVRKPVFTSDNAHNHLISFAEVCCMYLLVWSPQCWGLLTKALPAELIEHMPAAQHAKLQKQQQTIQTFASGLGQVQRLLAHLPVAMIFDDHDISDDWNLTAEWEQTAYQHPFSRRIIGNALLGYCLFQGWGNAPEQHQPLLTLCQQAATVPGSLAHDECINALLKFNQWRYQWPTEPPLIVLDTRTQRWRSEVSPDQPSGLMDWESITDLQQQLRGHSAVLLVSPAPVFGVKLIETIQHLFTAFGKPLLVDAESWMAHPGSAHALLNLFRHPKTPQNFVILSGDVHYSFVFQVALRCREQSPSIWQITSSGLKNQFPDRLLKLLDRSNRWLYASWSPLNWLTKRRQMKVTHHKPLGASAGQRLVNSAGIGLLQLSDQGVPEKVLQLTADGKQIEFDLTQGDDEISQDYSL
ncbi:alkaline phosphatase D family protein [Rheinheimera marina]|uniref:Alkaline phosphatase D family protein n=1 Tax=Rheinheimera marina TaxID=1774958 RepID=A0ABV9JNQ2_9GAMM